MADVHSPEVRSKNMRAIRSKNTKPELLVRKSLHAAGYRYRLHGSDLPGRPDIVLPKYRSVIFVQGCFWHGHHCKYFKLPQTRAEFWQTKIKANQARDTSNIEKLNQLGWHVILIWECGIKTDGPGLPEIVSKVRYTLGKNALGSPTSVTTIPI